MPKASPSPLRDLILQVIVQLPMRSTTAGQLRAITGLDRNRISFSLHHWVQTGHLVSVGEYGRRYFRSQADALTWAGNPVDLPVDQALIDSLATWCRPQLENTTRSRMSTSAPKDLVPRTARRMTPEERQLEAERRAQLRASEAKRDKPRLHYRHRPGSTALAPTHSGQASPPPVQITHNAGDDRPVVVPPNVRITRATIAPGRFEATGPVIGGFATLPLGHYLAEAGFSKYLESKA